ncbi:MULTISPECIES: hypothetical protein [Bradyrhizobium]|uniref:hypothetical protein n=1 Tax=Bradyrhizobium TaxID=374 RepID=UPI0004160EF8|nr:MULTISPECIES: hypothetical protein [Bradyrhizobium]MBR0884648.1 hypothetical protein [Bradyrhizobium liaoningense]MBR0948299.1 hypothetical protein [Bradyrhizobium liaoningense]MBR1004834.1 hypothetical protein [Bradyrhizobium liaoningense]MCP1739190.1 hypothetical protein [Bradyrhizobium japonicum]MCP1777374.1 hypothetical protein [Bradyrhizobium japonicum]
MLVDIDGVGDRSRLIANVWFPSAAIAAKVVTGAHIGVRVWQPVRHQSWPRLFGQRPAGFKWIPAGLC